MTLLFLRNLILVIGCSCTSFALRSLSSSPNDSKTYSAIPFDQFKTVDDYGRSVKFHVSQGQAKLPLFLFVGGSGCESNFWRRADGTISLGYQGILNDVLRNRGRVMVVEKPGVNLLDSTNKPGTALECSEQFKSEHTLERWAEALDAAVEASLQLPHVDDRLITAIGHSEGAISVAKLGSINPKVTHIVILSGSGATQVFDFVVNKQSDQIMEVYTKLDEILRNPDATSKMYRGHPAKRWASFFKVSTSELLVSSKADLLLIHGVEDRSVPVQTFDFLISDLKRQNRRLNYIRIDGANHSLNNQGDRPGMVREEFLKRFESGYWISLFVR